MIIRKVLIKFLQIKKINIVYLEEKTKNGTRSSCSRSNSLTITNYRFDLASAKVS